MKVWVVIKTECDEKTMMDYSSLVGVYDTFEKAEKIGKKVEQELNEEFGDDVPAWVEVIESEVK